MGKFANSKALAGASFGVLKSEKKLAAIPAVSAITCGIIAVAVGGGVVLTADFIANPAPGQDDFSLTPASWAIGIVGLFIIGLVSQMFAATLIAAANERLDGGSFTMGQAFSKATTRTPSILGWSAINSTVGLVLQAIRDKAGFLGDLASAHGPQLLVGDLAGELVGQRLGHAVVGQDDGVEQAGQGRLVARGALGFVTQAGPDGRGAGGDHFELSGHTRPPVIARVL